MSSDDVRFLLIALPIPVINPNGISPQINRESSTEKAQNE
jgi:hypothetical protein